MTTTNTSPQPAGDVAVARLGLAQVNQGPQHAVPGRVPKGVVELFEVVDVQHDHADRIAVALGARQLPDEGLV